MLELNNTTVDMDNSSPWQNTTVWSSRHWTVKAFLMPAWFHWTCRTSPTSCKFFLVQQLRLRIRWRLGMWAELICTSVLVRHLWNSVIYWISTSNILHVTYGVVSKSRYFTMFRNHSRISHEPCVVYTFSTASQSQELISSANTSCLHLHLNLFFYAQICRWPW